MRCIASCILVLASAASAKEKMAVLELAVDAQESAALLAQVKAVNQQLLTDLAADGRYEVLGTSDLQALVGIERQKQLLGCSDESSSCMSELAGALGAPLVLVGQVSRSAGALRIDLKVLQAEKAVVLGREGDTFASETDLPSAASHVLSRLLGQLPGAGATRALKRLPWATGAIGALAGSIGLIMLGVQGAQTGALQGRLDAHDLPVAEAVSWRSGIYAERSWAVALLITGTLVAVGSLLWYWLW